MWIEAIVMPRSESRATADEGSRFRDDVLAFLRAHHLLGAVKWMSEPGRLPLITLHCQPRVLEQLRKSSEFEAGRSMSLELYT
ncbi:hypothetical protein P2318_07485 [Myxococcaceae bacterium GXIMD 01537]